MKGRVNGSHGDGLPFPSGISIDGRKCEWSKQKPLSKAEELLYIMTPFLQDYDNWKQLKKKGKEKRIGSDFPQLFPGWNTCRSLCGILSQWNSKLKTYSLACVSILVRTRAVMNMSVYTMTKK